MKPHEELLNSTLAEIHATLVTRPLVMEFIHLSIISFNADAKVIRGMTEIDTMSELPTVHCGGSTNYGPMFDLLVSRINTDVPALAATGVNVRRPAVFLLTDGAPMDPPASWTDALGRLKDPDWKYRPHIITYGFGASSEPVLLQIYNKAAYLAERPEENRTALASALSSLLHTLVSSAQNQALDLPTDVKGFRSVHRYDYDVVEEG